MTISWVTERRKVKDLKEYKNNPRKFTEKGLADLEASLSRLGYIDPIAVNTDGTIIGGHARKKMLLKLGIKEVDVRVPDRTLTDAEIDEAIIRLNKNIAGEWDFEKLGDWYDQANLVEWGFFSEEVGFADETDMPKLPSGDRDPFRQMTFTLHDEQAEAVERALFTAKQMGEFADSPNENSNGNALARVCETFLTEYGNS